MAVPCTQRPSRFFNAMKRESGKHGVLVSIWAVVGYLSRKLINSIAIWLAVFFILNLFGLFHWSINLEGYGERNASPKARFPVKYEILGVLPTENKEGMRESRKAKWKRYVLRCHVRLLAFVTSKKVIRFLGCKLLLVLCCTIMDV